jgi:hypothetical protein
MSHFTKLRTQITDADGLVKALADVGFKEVEVHEAAQHLYGYQGDERPQTAEVIVRRKYIGLASNDVGFKRQADGTFEAIISEYDRRRYSQAWLNRLAQRYAYHVALAKLAEQGFDLVTDQAQEGEQIHLVLRRVI